MPIIKAAIAAQIEAFMVETTGSDITDESQKQISDFANNLAGVIETAIKSATVTVTPGIPVTTAVTPAFVGSGVTTGPGTGTLS